MSDDTLTAALAEIRDRGYENGAMGARCVLLSDAAAEDVPRLLAAVEAALKLADEWKAKAFELWEQIAARDLAGTSAGLRGVGASVHENHANILQRDVTRALLGEDGTGG